MANYISPEAFVKETKGNAYDIDHTAGVQCVDGIKKFNVDVYGKYDFNCGSCGYAYGLWTNYGTNGVEKYFNQHPFSEVQEGDWVIWNKGSKDAPKSHVAMFSKKVNSNTIEAYGQNQNGKKYFNFANVNTNGILGVLRPKIYESELQYRAYVEGKGWTDWISSGTAGTVGESRKLIAIEIRDTYEVKCNAHISHIGWKDYGVVNDGKQIGESGESLECLQLKGNFKYRVHIAYYGWTNYTEADGVCTLGSVGLEWSLEAIEINRH